MTTRLPIPLFCLNQRGFVRNDDWLLLDLSLSLSGNIAVSGYNKISHHTCVDVYSVINSDSVDKPKTCYSKEFDKYETEMGIHRGRCVSFVDSDGENIVTCVGNKLEVIQVSKDVILQSRMVNGSAECMSVRKEEIFISVYQSCQIFVYDITNLTETRTVTLEGNTRGYHPYDMTVVDDKLVACVGHVGTKTIQKTLIFEQKNGPILSELSTPKDLHWYKASVTVSVSLGVVAVVRADMSDRVEGIRYQIVFYSLLSKHNSSFFIVEAEFGINRIRISERGDRLITGNCQTGEVKSYDIAELFSYDCMKSFLVSQFQRHEVAKVTEFFALPNDQAKAIMQSKTPMEDLLLALEEKGVIQPADVDRFLEALRKLEVDPSHYIVVDIYHRIKKPTTLYERFLASLSTHLTASLPADLCVHFKIPDAKRNSIQLSQNPSLSLLLALDEMDIIKPSDVTALEQPLTHYRLVQAVATIYEYQSRVEDERSMFQKKYDVHTLTGKRNLFLKLVQKKLKSWYETMTPVPWKKSCRWKSKDLFIPCRLILTDSKTRKNLEGIDEQCKLSYTEIFTHTRLRRESVVILEGDPGSGKTMLVSQLAFEWSQGLISAINLLILLPLKFVQKKTFAEAIKDFYLPEDQSLSVTDIEDVITSEERGCCILLDGLEEYNSDDKSTTEEPSEKLNVILKKYSSCKVVITSRSDYAQGLPPCPILKIGQFGDCERSAYIKKLFPQDVEKQVKVKKVFEDTPFILDLCNVPLLFVLAVHIIADKENLHKDQLNRVTPFIKNIVESLLTPVSSPEGHWNMALAYGKYQDNPIETLLQDTGFDTVSNWNYSDDIARARSSPPTKLRHALRQGKSAVVSLEMLAFNGLCKGKQQLSWPKTFVDENVRNIQHWVDSGILVVEEAITIGKSDQTIDESFQEVTDAEESIDKTTFSSSASWAVEKYEEYHAADAQEERVTKDAQQVLRKENVGSIKSARAKESLKTSFSGLTMINRAFENVPHQNITFKRQVKDQGTDFTPKVEDAKSFTLKHVPLQVKFLHKVIQEWFAARHLASLCWKYAKLPFRTHSVLLRKHLLHINPSDLHYVLRFTCSFCPTSCHVILNYLFERYRDKDGNLPEHILNCICLYLTEHNGDKDVYVKDLVREMCKITFTIHSGDNRLLQESKTDILQFASNCGFPILELQLQDILVTAREQELILNSGARIETLQSLQVLKINRWDQVLKEEDYSNVLKFIANCASVQEACFHFPQEPPLLDRETKEKLKPHVQKVTWKIGSMLSKTLDITTGEWMINLRTLETKPVQQKEEEMIWKSETVEWTLGEHYCSIFLHHFTGVDVNITSTEEKILRVIPYATLRRNNKLTLNVWLCNDLESDFQSVIKSEEANGGIPLDSYDTFQLNCISGPGTSKVTLSLNELQVDEWHLEENENALYVERLANSSKSKSSFSLQRADKGDDDGHIYLLLKVTQRVGEEERDTSFAIRKMVCDLRTPALFKRPCSQYKQRNDRLSSTEVQRRPYTAVVYIDPVKNLGDDAILTLWLSPFDSNSEEFKFLQEEQELQLKHIVDTVNSFVIFDDKVVVVSKTRFLNGKWSLSPGEKKIKTDRIRFGSRAKFQFIGRRKGKVDADYIDLEVEVFQEDKCKIRFMKELEMDDLRYEIRRRRMRVSSGSVSDDSSTFSSGAEMPPERVTQSSLTAKSTTVPGDSSPSQTEGKSVNLEERLRICFMFLKKSLAKEWQDVGRYLHLTDDKLKLLKEDYKDDVEERIYHMLLSWKKCKGSKATPEKLMEALTKVEREDLAEKVAKM